MDDLPPEVINKKKNMRTSVSAEAFGVWNKKTDFKPPSYPKPKEVVEAL